MNTQKLAALAAAAGLTLGAGMAVTVTVLTTGTGHGQPFPVAGRSQPSPQDILRADGYSVVMTLSEAQMQAAAGPDTANLAPYVIDGTVGTCDGATCGGYGTEIVMRLTPAGVTFFGPNLDALRQSGYSVRMTGSDIVMRKN